MPIEITIQSILNRRHFEQAQVVAGRLGLNQTFKWIHILETLDLHNLIKGQEIILTTGIQIAQSEEKFLDFVENIHALGVAGLCIELGKNVPSVPTRVISLANELNFPIIVFPVFVPFVEITQDIHRHLINQQYELLQNLENYAQELYKMTLHITHYEQILMRLHKYLNVSIVFELKGEEILYLPNLRKSIFENLVNQEKSPHILSFEIYLFEQPYGKLYIYNERRVLTEFDMLILDRTAGALSNYLLRHLYIDEKKENENRNLLTQWLEQTTPMKNIEQFLEEVAPKTIDKPWLVLLQDVQHTTKTEEITYHKIFVRTILEKFGFFSFSFQEGRNLVFIIANLWQEKNQKNRLLQVTEQINSYQKQNANSKSSLLAAGYFVKSFEEISHSYLCAKNTLQLRKKDAQLAIFYEDIPLQHMIFNLKQNEELLYFAKQYLEPLLTYDSMNNGHLVKTLKKYLELHGLKKETAKELFIVRQTLYHRLDKIESLLGMGFMDSDKRLALELMLHLIENKSEATALLQ